MYVCDASTTIVKLKVKVDSASNWSVGGQTRHIDVKQYFLWKLKEEGL